MNLPYPIYNLSQLQDFTNVYIPLVLFQLNEFKLAAHLQNVQGDHFGLQVMSSQEFDTAHEIISSYSQTIKQGIIHNRRNNTYKLNSTINTNNIKVWSIEMFEPKPNADLTKLLPGIEHVSLAVDNLDQIYSHFVDNALPVEKFVEYNGSRFFKTRLTNLVQVEFRDNPLWQDLLREQSTVANSSEN